MAPHGTRTRYQHHRCRCDDCRAAQATYVREWARRQRIGRPDGRRNRPVRTPSHGTAYRYKRFECRCERCRAANARQSRRDRRRQRREKALTARRRRFDLAPLERLAGAGSVVEMARLLEVHKEYLYRWRRHGLTEARADELAARLNLHPANVWPDWA